MTSDRIERFYTIFNWGAFVLSMGMVFNWIHSGAWPGAIGQAMAGVIFLPTLNDFFNDNQWARITALTIISVSLGMLLGFELWHH